MDDRNGFCDLHIHSTYSDGVLSVEQIVEESVSAGLAAISITDHDTIAGQDEALNIGRKKGIEVVTGIEFSTKYHRKNVHILGYLVDIGDRLLKDEISYLRESRISRARKIVEKLNSLGFALTFDDVEEESGGGAVGRPHIAAAMFKKGYVSSYNEAFTRFLADNAPCYVPKDVFSIEKVFELIDHAGGVPVWAHPGRDIYDGGILDILLPMGLAGIEVWHPNHSYDIEKAILEVVSKNGLIPTGGSDFHNIEARGIPIGGKGVPYESVTALKAAAAGKRLK